MNKSTIGSYILVGATIFLVAFFLGRESNTQIFKEKDSLKEVKLQNSLDSLSNLQAKSDTVIVRIKETKTKLKTEYVNQIVYIDKLPFDSLVFLFSRYYPAQDSIN